MTAELEIVARTIAAPAAVAFALLWLCRWVLPIGISERFGLPAALSAGFCIGYFLQPDAEFIPERHWHWLPYLGVAAAFVGGSKAGLVGRSNAPSFVVWLACAALAVGTAWLLVPMWPKLWPPRAISVPLLAVYLLLLMSLLAALPQRLHGRTFAGLLTMTATSVALLVAIGVTVKIGLVGLAVAAAMAGCWAGLGRRVGAAAKRDSAPVETPSGGIARDLIAGFAVLIGGLAYVGTITPTTPLPIILLAPLTPLTLWLFAAGPLAKLQGWKAAAAQAAVVIVPLVLLLAWVALSDSHEEW